MIPPPNNADSQVCPGRRTAGAGPDAISTGRRCHRTPIELPRLHHQGGEWLDKHPFLFRLEHEGDHRVRGELCAHCPTDSLPCHAPPGIDKECVLCIVHKGSAVATRLIVSFLEALQVRIKATMAQKRLRQVKADLAVLSIQPSEIFMK